MKYAISSYSFHQHIRRGEISQKDTVHLAASMGFEGIEFTDLQRVYGEPMTHEEQLAFAEELKTEARACGIEIVAYAIGAKLYWGDAEKDAAEVERLCRQVDVAAALGAPVMRHDVIGSEKVGGRLIGFERMLPTIAENTRKVAAYAETKGVRTCSENHGFVAQDSDRMVSLFQTVGHDNYGLLVDMGNFSCVDEDSVTAVSRVAAYAVHVHVKDMKVIPYGEPTDPEKSYITTRGANKLLCCTLGEGSIPVKQCLTILQRAGYDGWCSLEYEGYKDCMEEIPKALTLLKSYMA